MKMKRADNGTQISGIFIITVCLLCELCVNLCVLSGKILLHNHGEHDVLHKIHKDYTVRVL